MQIVHENKNRFNVNEEAEHRASKLFEKNDLS